MRKMQLSFTIESFHELADNGERQVVKGYIDANNVYEVLKEEIEALREIYDKNSSFEEFCHRIQSYDKPRFGCTEIDKKDDSF